MSLNWVQKLLLKFASKIVAKYQIIELDIGYKIRLKGEIFQINSFSLHKNLNSPSSFSIEGEDALNYDYKIGYGYGDVIKL